MKTSNHLSGIACLAFAITLLCIGKPASGRNNTYQSPNQKGVKTIIIAHFEDTVKYQRPKLNLIDFSVFIDTKNLPEYTTELKNGWCRFEVYLTHPLFAQLKGVLLNVPAYNMFSKWFFTDGIFLEPGDSISVEVKKPDANTNFILPNLSYSGKGSEKMRCQQEVFAKTVNYPFPGSAKNIQNFALADSINNMIVTTINTYALSPQAKTLLQTNLISMLVPDISEIIIGNDQLKGMNIHDPVTKKMYADRITASAKVINLADTILRYSNLDFYNRDFVRRRALLEYAINTGADYPKEFKLEYYNALVKYIPAYVIKERILAHYTERSIQSAIAANQPIAGTDIQRICHQYLKTADKESVYYPVIKENYENLEKGLVAGAAAFPFELPDTSGKVIKLDDFKGKIVVMDFMFNSCLPCRELLPFLKDLGKKYHDSAVVFVTVCTDKNKEQWLQANSHLTGFNTTFVYTAGKGYGHPIVNHYNILTYPTLVLIDKNGKLITARAPDPRFDEGRALSNLINAALR